MESVPGSQNSWRDHCSRARQEYEREAARRMGRSHFEIPAFRGFAGRLERLPGQNFAFVRIVPLATQAKNLATQMSVIAYDYRRSLNTVSSDRVTVGDQGQ